MFKRLVSTTVNHVPLVPCHVYTPIVKLSQQQVDKDPQVYSFIQVHAAQNHYFVNSRLQNCHCLKRWTSWLRLYLSSFSSTFVTFANFTLPERNFSRDPSAGLSNMWRLEPRAMDLRFCLGLVGLKHCCIDSVNAICQAIHQDSKKHLQLFQSKGPLQDHYRSMHLPAIFIVL